MDPEDEKIEDEKVVEFNDEASKPEVAEESETEKTDQDEDSVEALQAEVDALKATVQEQNEKIEELTGQLSDANDKNQKLSSLVKGEEALAEGTDDKIEKPDVLEQFQLSDGAEATNIWKQNKPEILASLRRN